MRRVMAAVALVATFAVSIAAASPAQADPGSGGSSDNSVRPQGNNSGDPLGFNGTIKVHAGDSEDEPIRANEPHVGCTFHIHGFGFDASATGSWRIVAWPPTGDASTIRWSGSWSASAGEWRTGLLTATSADMVSGRAHFKVFADQSGAPGGEKHKVFWVDCGAAATAQPFASPTPTPTPGPTPTPTIPPVVGGVQQPPMGGVSPIVEAPRGAAPGGAQGPVVGGVAQPPAQLAGLSGLPNTSTAGPGVASTLLFLLFATGMRRMR